MHPTLTLADISLPSYALFTALGWLLGGVIFYREFRRLGWPLETMLFVMMGCVVGALVGSVVLSLLFVPVDRMLALLAEGQFPGRTVVGGIVGGFLGVEVMKKIRRYPHSTGDAFALAIPLGHALGRVGCWFAGCCHGSLSDLPWAVRYPSGAPAHQLHVAAGSLPGQSLWSLAVHPAPLYELVCDLMLAWVLYRIRGRLVARGSLFLAYLVGYALLRCALEWVRGDSPYLPGLAIKPVQILLLLGAVWAGWRLCKRERLATSPGL